MKNISITDTTFHRLEKMITSFNDTPETVINKLLEHYEKSKVGDTEVVVPEATNRKIQSYTSEIIPNLRFAKLLDAGFDDTRPDKIKWNEMLKLALIKVMESCKDINELRRISGAKVVKERKEDTGYKFIETHNFSYQGVNSINAAAIVNRCANFLGCEAYFEFEWRYNEGAYKPGERALLKIPSVKVK